MTCIIGLEYEGKVYIGGDSCGSAGWEKGVISRQPKVFRVGALLVGYSGSMRQLNLLRHQVTIGLLGLETTTQLPEEYIVTRFVPAARQCFIDNGMMGKADDVENINGMMLVGMQGELYQIGSQLDVTHYKRGYCAIGSGGDYALGSLITQMKTACAMEKRADGSLTVPEPVVMLKRALDVAAMMNAAVCEPFYVECI